ncbi:MAG: preprotein translocase subunit SecA [Clostridia bacterium]|nr:preprotein translocase subunit SecA [Clostridia bacterium]
MVFGFIKNMFDDNKKEISKLSKQLESINALEAVFEKKSDDELKEMTEIFKGRLNNGENLESILPEAFAVVREASKRVLKMRHFDVQLMGGIVLHQGRIAEMKTGEGKTLVATLPVYLNALAGNGVHVVTVNDYLAKRDSQWMGQLYEFLGLSVGLLINGMGYREKKEAYNSDITYGTNNEFGFDYLRDNLVMNKDNKVQRGFNYAIVDEVDSILIDEARTPLIISGAAESAKSLYQIVDTAVKRLKKDEDYTIEEKEKNVQLTEDGILRIEKMLSIENLYDNAEEKNIEMQNHIKQALKANYIMRKDIDYVVNEGKVIIVDEFTGRLMFGRRYSEGLHQAIEAKENVKVEKESRTYAQITFQNYFRMYKKIAGMTGTAKTEEEEFIKIYGMDVVVIPTNKELMRIDHPDAIYRTEMGKYSAVVDEIIKRHETGQPVLVGTISIEKSEFISSMLERKGIPHQVLNAKYHEKEAEIVSQAGQKGMVTIATNMAGRGTDIVLGEGVQGIGGLAILGTERHESRRIDNQLRGRSGRQGDPGSSQFFISMEDELLRLFGSEKIYGILDKLGMDDSMPLENNMLSSSVENAQKKVESRNFDIRKTVLEYDDVLNKQREVIYEQRNRVLEGDNVKESIVDMIEKTVESIFNQYSIVSEYPEEWNMEGLLEEYSSNTVPNLPSEITPENLVKLEKAEILDLLKKTALEAYDEREEKLGEETLRDLERVVLLKNVDAKWMDHLDGMEDLRQGIYLRAYGQRNPLTEYKYESFDMFSGMIDDIRQETVRILFRVEVVEKPEEKKDLVVNTSEETKKAPVKAENKAGRNDPCPCGSGKKYKHCCGK